MVRVLCTPSPKAGKSLAPQHTVPVAVTSPCSSPSLEREPQQVLGYQQHLLLSGINTRKETGANRIGAWGEGEQQGIAQEGLCWLGEVGHSAKAMRMEGEGCSVN